MRRNSPYDVRFEYDDVQLDLRWNDGEDGPQFTIERAPIYAQQQFEAVTENSRPAYQVINIPQKDYSGGMGQELFDTTTKYSEAVNVDTRVKNTVTLAGAVNTASTITTDILNKTQENWSSSSVPYNWTSSNFTVARSTDKYAGTYCAQLTWTDVGAYYRYTIPNPTAFQSEEVTVTAYVKTSCHAFLRITDDGGSTDGDVHTAGGSYEQLSVTRTINAAATYIYIEVRVPEITDGGFEAWDDATTLTNWTVGDGAIAMITEAGNDGGTYTCAINSAATGNIYQDLAWSAYYQGQEFTFTSYLYATGANSIRIGIDDGVGTTYSSYNDGDSDWDQATVSRTLDASATRLRIIVDAANVASVRKVDGASLIDDASAVKVDSFAISVTGGLTHSWQGTPICFFENNSELYLLTTKELCRWDETNTRWLNVFGYDTTGTVFTDGIAFKDYIHLALGTDTAWYYCTLPETFTQCAQSTCKASLFATNAATFWAKVSDNTIKSATSPESQGSDPLSTATTVGDSSAAINDLQAFYYYMFVGKEDALYYIYSDGTVYTASSFHGARSSNNFLGMRQWDTSGYQLLLFPHGDNSISWWQWGGATDEIGPVDHAPQRVDFHGQVTSIVPDRKWAYITTSPTGSNTKSKLIAMRFDSSYWYDHPLAEINLGTINCGCLCSLHSSKRRLWYAGSLSGTVGVYYINLPATNDPTGDSNYTYETNTAYLKESFKDAGKSGATKSFLYADIETDGCSSTVYITAKYSVDGGTVKTLAAIYEDGMERYYFPVDTTGKELQMYYYFTTGSSSSTPELVKTVIGARSAEEPYPLYRMTVRATGAQVRRGGVSSEQKSGASISSELMNMASKHYVKMTYWLDNVETTDYVTLQAPTPKRVLGVSRRESLYDIIALHAPTS